MSVQVLILFFAQDHLYEEIQKHAKQYEIAPQNAMIDKIWKATPGYNGRQVDMEASYNNMKKLKQFDQKHLEFKEVSPSVHLEDLSPAPIYRGHPDKKMVGLTINVAWGNEYLPRILEILKKHDVKATFFFRRTLGERKFTICKNDCRCKSRSWKSFLHTP